MNAAGFVNRIRSLHNLDWDHVPFLDERAWPTFRDDPPAFLMRTDEATADRIFAAVEARQKDVAPGATLVDALEVLQAIVDTLDAEDMGEGPPAAEWTAHWQALHDRARTVLASPAPTTPESDLPSQALWDETRKALASMRNEIGALRAAAAPVPPVVGEDAVERAVIAYNTTPPGALANKDQMRAALVSSVAKPCGVKELLKDVLAYLEGGYPNVTSGGQRNADLRSRILAALSLPATDTARPLNSGEMEARAWDCDKWPAWLHEVVARTNEVADRLDMSSEQAHAYAVLAALSSAPSTPQGWRPLTCKDDKMTYPLPADETVVDVMLQDGTVCSAWYSCNIMEAGDWDFLPVKDDGEPNDAADSLADKIVAWRPTPPAGGSEPPDDEIYREGHLRGCRMCASDGIGQNCTCGFEEWEARTSRLGRGGA